MAACIAGALIFELPISNAFFGYLPSWIRVRNFCNQKAGFDVKMSFFEDFGELSLEGIIFLSKVDLNCANFLDFKGRHLNRMKTSRSRLNLGWKFKTMLKNDLRVLYIGFLILACNN